MDNERVAFGWAVNSYFGWGVTGLNWVLHWPGVALSAMPDLAAELPPHDSRARLLDERLRQSLGFQRELRGTQDFPCFVGLGNDFRTHGVAGGLPLNGTPTIAVVFFEDLAMAAANVDRLHAYPLVLAASRWNLEWLLDRGIETARLCHQGYDPVLFHPVVRQPRTNGRFRVFSGGKAEYRKGQDIVIEAFARFAEKHDDAVLVAAWGGPWPGLAQNLSQTRLGAPPGAELGLPNFRAWAQRAGIKPHQIEIVPPLPNWRMAEVYRGVDCAVFPNRAEGGTNLVAMECMACGIPTILSVGHGHADLPAAHWMGLEGADVLAAAMEQVYTTPPAQRALGQEWAWPARMEELAAIMGETGGPFLPSIARGDHLNEMAMLAAGVPPGAFVEVGVYKGGGAQVLYRIAEDRAEQLHLFDTFAGVPVANCEMGDKHEKGEFADIDLPSLRSAMPDAVFHIGKYPETHEDIGSVGFIHCDCDQYDSHRAVIDLMWPKVVPGGVLLFDDYPYLEGARRAVDERFSPAELLRTEAGRAYVRKGG